MARLSRTFRIFVSSTFTDLKEERNALQKIVFPELRKLCMHHGCRFQAIDLRWGIRDEAALDQQTMKICLEEIARCQKTTPRPNFIVLLGDRYGWRPLPSGIPADEFESIAQSIKNDHEKALLLEWYRRDDNAVPQVYDLKPRTFEYAEWKTWESVEKPLRSILMRAIDQMPLSEEARSKYIASATEQEIMRGALNVKGAHEHVFCFFRKIRNLPGNECARDFIDLEETGKPDEEAKRLLADLKKRLNAVVSDNVLEYEVEWNKVGPSSPHLKPFCDDVLKSLTRVIEAEIAQLEEIDPLKQEITDHEAFGRERSQFFVGRTDSLQAIADYVSGTDLNPMVVFGASGSGKTAVMAKAVDQAQRDHPNTNVICRYIGATPGSSDGRTLLESVCRQIYDLFKFEDQKTRLLSEIEGPEKEKLEKGRQIEEEYSIPTEYQKLSGTFRDFLTRIPVGQELIVFLDALDQLASTDQARGLGWFPTRLSSIVRLVVSTVPTDCFSILEKRHPEEALVELLPMPKDEGSELLDLWLKESGRRLQAHQRHEVLARFEQCGLPLYLKLAFEEARKWKSYSDATELNADIPGILRGFLTRLSSNANHGKTLVTRSLGYLLAAKNGLTEDELMDVLSLDEEVFQDFGRRSFHEPPEKQLPAVIWSRLHFDLESYLTERSADNTSLLAFYHRQLAAVLNDEFLTGDLKEELHKRLSAYFAAQDLQLERESKRVPNVRKVSELPYQQTHAKLWDELEHTLCDLKFIEAKCVAGLIYGLIQDYAAALAALPEAQPERLRQSRSQDPDRVQRYVRELIAYAKGERTNLSIIPSVRPWTEEEIGKDSERIQNNPSRVDRVRDFAQFVNSETHVLPGFARFPGFCVQQAYNFADSGPVSRAGEEMVSEERQSVMILRHSFSRPRHNPHPSLLKSLEGHTGGITAVDVTPDGRRAVSGSDDQTVRLWDTATGECLRTCEGHTGKVWSVNVIPDGTKAVSGSGEGAVRVWDLDTGECLQTLEGHTGPITAVDITPDGRRVVSGSEDKTIRLWDLDTGKCLKTLKVSEDDVKTKRPSVEDLPSELLEQLQYRVFSEMLAEGIGLVSSVSVTPDGRRTVSGSWDQTVRLWDLETGECLRNLEGHTSFVSCVSITPDGRKAVSGSWDQTVRLWDLETGKCLRSLWGHTRWVRSVRVTPDGRRAVSGSDDQTVRLWDLETGECLKIFWGHNDSVGCVSVTPDCRKAVSGGDDQTVRVWDLETGESLKTIEGHARTVICVSVTPDGRKAVSGSWDQTVRLWDLDAERLNTFWGHTGWVSCVSMTPDGRRVVSGSEDQTVRLWDLDTERLKTFWGHTGWVSCVSMTPDGRRAVSGSEDQTVRLWDLETGEWLSTLQGHTGWVRCVIVTPDGRRVVSASDDQTVRLWDLETGECLKAFQGHTGEVRCLSMTPDGRRAVSGSDDKTVRVWDLEAGECLRILEGHTGGVDCLSVMPDGRRVVSGGHSVLGDHTDDTVRLWDLVTGVCLRTLEGHTDDVSSVSASPDGTKAVSGSWDGTVRLWDLDTGECVGVFRAGARVRVSNMVANRRFVCAAGNEVVFLKLK